MEHYEQADSAVYIYIYIYEEEILFCSTSVFCCIKITGLTALQVVGTKQ